MRIRALLKVLLSRITLVPQFCRRCGQEAESYHVPDEVWRAVTGGYTHNLCFRCFARLAQRTGYPASVWVVRPRV